MVLFTLILAHLLGDFYFQTDAMARSKANSLTKHCLHHFLLAFCGLLLIFFWENDHDHFLIQVLAPSLFLGLAHFIIDKLKIRLSAATAHRPLYQLQVFLGDQILHVLMVLLSGFVFLNIDPNELVNGAYQQWTNPSEQLSPMNRILCFIIFVILATTVSGHFIRILVGIIPEHLSLFEGRYVLRNPKTESIQIDQSQMSSIDESYTFLVNKKSDRSRGVIIGYLERLLVIILILNGAFSSIAFLIAAKSIARFKQLDDRDFAEYFLLGTLSSIFLGILSGLVAKQILF